MTTQSVTIIGGGLAGTEGYVGSTMGGLIAGINVGRLLTEQPLLELPPTTMMGALLHYITHAEPKNFQPMKAAMGLLPDLRQRVRGKQQRYAAYAERAQTDHTAYLARMGFALEAVPVY